MNEKGREVLVKAALDGVRQIRGWFDDGAEGRCAMGVLHDGMKDLGMTCGAFDLRLAPQSCPECGESKDTECHLIVHLNDDHRFDFLTIARKLA